MRVLMLWTLVLTLAVLVGGISAEPGSQTLPIPLPSGGGRAGEGLFAPIGGGYGDTFDGWIGKVVADSPNDEIRIVVLASTYHTDPFVITPTERAQLTAEAQARADQVLEACQALITGSQSCVVVLAPIFVRSDAIAIGATSYFDGELDAIFILGGDQAIAMQVLENTQVETVMQQKFAAGTMLAGTSAGNAVQSKTMIAGFNGIYGPDTGLTQGAVDVWNTVSERGLSFGLDNVILDQHFHERARIGRLLNALTLANVPRVGVGVDSYTGVFVTNRTTVGSTYGLYVASILDAETYSAAANATFQNSILSIHDVLAHLIAPGDSTYDITTRTHSLAPVPTYQPRTFGDLLLPQGAGALWLGGNFRNVLTANPVLTRFAEIAGGSAGKLLIVADGYADDTAAQAAASAYAAAFGMPSKIVIVDDTPTEVNGTYTGIVLIGADKSKIIPASVATVIGSRWQNGTPMFADDAMTAILGTWYANHAPSDIGGGNEEFEVQGSYIVGNTTVAAGLGWVNASLETTVLIDLRTGRWYSLAYTHPDTLALALTDGTALELSPYGTRVVGTNGVLMLDLSIATLGTGTNNGMVIANGLMDTFAPDEIIVSTGNVIANNSMETDANSDKIPDGWKVKNLGAGDARKLASVEKPIAHDGDAAFQFKGAAGENSLIQQKLSPAGVVTDGTLTLEGYVMAKNAATGFSLQLKVAYADDALPNGKLILELPAGTSAYTAYSDSLILAGEPTSVKVIARYTNPAATGKIWLDSVSVTYAPPSAARGASNNTIPLPVAP